VSQNAVLTQGTVLARGDGGSPEVFATVPAIVSITGPDSTKAEIDVTDLGSQAKEYKGGLADFGRMSVEMQYIPGDPTHTLIRNDFINATSPVRNWRLTFTNGKKWDFAAYVSGAPGNIAAENVVRATLNLRLSGPVLES
jgi:Lambda phage tail tube protein, TTP